MLVLESRRRFMTHQGMPEELADGRAPELQSLHLPLPGDSILQNQDLHEVNLLGGLKPSEKYDFVSWDDDVQ